MHIALMGGTFNPVHYGHLRVAEEVREGLEIEKVLFAPTFITPHKSDESMVPAPVRLEMVAIAVRDNPGFEASDIEIKRGGISYTIDTIKELLKKGPKGLKLSLIIGDDSFNDITTWCDYESLFKLSNMVVVPRPGYPLKKPGEALPVELARKFWYDASTDSYANQYGNTLTYAGTTLMDISSSDIRRRVSEGLSIRYLLPPGVVEYIETNSLYR